jgi:tyrosyl-tRNA synthetase
LKASFGAGEMHPGDLKASVETYLNRLMDPVRKIFESPELKKLTERDYPHPQKEKAAKLTSRWQGRQS